jgi:divalent metal cation (Fe/Co/Zn/Cd) transporter
MLQRLALYTTLVLVLDTAGLVYTDSMFWCVLGLFIANEWLTRHDVWQDIEREVQALRKRNQHNNNDSKDSND